jgi:hypothetical protein
MVDARRWFYAQSFNSGTRAGCQEGEPAEIVRLVRWQYVKGCKRCEAIQKHAASSGHLGPHHDPSRGCKSGGREHCSCPVCWG